VRTLVAIDTECFRKGLLEGLREIYGGENYSGTGFFLRVHYFGFHQPVSFPTALCYSMYAPCHVIVDTHGVITLFSQDTSEHICELYWTAWG